MATYCIDPSAVVNGDGTEGSPFSTVPTLIRDSEYLFKAGTIYQGGILVSTAADADKIITFGAYGNGDKPILTSRIDVSTGWTLAAGVYSKDVGYTPAVFYVGFSSVEGLWGGEITKNTTTPTSPGEGEWGASGNIIYYKPSPTDPTPETGDAFMQYTRASSLSGMIVTTSYINIGDIVGAYSGQHGFSLNGSGTVITNINASRVECIYNGNQTTHLRIGNGFAVNNMVSDCIIADSIMHHNVDHGANTEGLTGATVRPRNILYSRIKSYENGSCGVAFIGAFTSGIYYQVGASVKDSEIYNNGTGLLSRVGGSVAINSGSGILYKNAEGDILRNKVYANGGAGIWLKTKSANGTFGSTDANGGNTSIISNLVYGNTVGNTIGTTFESFDTGGIALCENYGDLVGAGTIGTVKILGNTVVYNNSVGIYQYYSPIGYKLEIYNNIVTNNLNYDMNMAGNLASQSGYASGNTFSATQTTAQIRHNSINYTVAATWSALAVVGTDTFESPLFVDYASSNYRLQAGSPCFETGNIIPGFHDVPGTLAYDVENTLTHWQPNKGCYGQGDTKTITGNFTPTGYEVRGTATSPAKIKLGADNLVVDLHSLTADEYIEVKAGTKKVKGFVAQGDNQYLKGAGGDSGKGKFYSNFN